MADYNVKQDKRRYVVREISQETECSCFFEELKRREDQADQRSFDGKRLRKLRVRQPTIGILCVGDVGWRDREGRVYCSIGCAPFDAVA